MALEDDHWSTFPFLEGTKENGKRIANRRSCQAQPKMYIQIREEEIAGEYPAPIYFQKAEDEGNELELFEGDDEDDFDYREEKKLEDWTLYNGEMRLVPLELLPMLPNVAENVTIFGSGVVSTDDGCGYAIEDEGTDGENINVNTATITSNDVGGLRIYLSAIREWKIEFGANMLFVWIRTDMFWYRLGKPSVQYTPFFKPVVKVAKIAIEIISLLKAESRVAKLSFSDIVKKFADKRKKDKEKTVTVHDIARAERYLVVHGQIILQQLREFPDSQIQRSSFSSGLAAKMLEAHYTPLKISKKMLRNRALRNTNPSAQLRPDANKKKPMRATTTKLVSGVWSRFYTIFNGEKSEKVEAEVTKVEIEGELQDEDSESDSEDILVVSKANQSKKSGSKRKATESTSSKWVGKSIVKTEDDFKVYPSVEVNSLKVNHGEVVRLNEDEKSQLLLVEYFYHDSDDDVKMFHGRLLCPGSDTVLGNASDERELFLLDQCMNLSVDSIRSLVPATNRIRPWGFQFRKSNYELDELERAIAKEDDKKGLQASFFFQKLYLPEKGGFFNLPKALGVGTGACSSCDLFESRQNEQEVSMDESSDCEFTYGGKNYKLQDFVYLDTNSVQDDSRHEVHILKESFKGSRNIGLKPWIIAKIVKIEVKREGKGKQRSAVPSKITAQRLFRPDDVNDEIAYKSDISEVYYSEKRVVVDATEIIGKCRVFGKSPDSATSLEDDCFFCEKSFDPKSRKLSANIPTSFKFSKQPQNSNGKIPHVKPLKTLDIFAGCGGLSEGLQQSGVSETKWAIEYEHPAAEAFALNHPNATVFCDNCNVVLRCMMEKGGELEDCISSEEASEQAAAMDADKRSKLPLPGDVEFINGGPPCQGFSGMNRFNDRAWSKVQCEMILAHLSFADFLRPRYFLLENVRNFVSFNKGETFRLTLASLLAMGYQVRFGVLQAGNYGVSQSRKRAFIWAASPDSPLPDWPQPRHVFASCQIGVPIGNGDHYFAVGGPGHSNGAPLRSITVRDSIGDLPKVHNGADEEEISYGGPPASWFQKRIRGQETVLRDHVTKEMNELNLERCKHIPKETPGADWRCLPEINITLSDGRQVALVPWCLPNTAARHNQWKGLFGRLDWAGHFPTSVTDPQPMGKVGMCFHPAQDRIVSVRECARSQGFPDGFRFSGSVLAKHRQIGNAVPPPLAFALGLSLRRALEPCKREVEPVE